MQNTDHPNCTCYNALLSFKKIYDKLCIFEYIYYCQKQIECLLYLSPPSIFVCFKKKKITLFKFRIKHFYGLIIIDPRFFIRLNTIQLLLLSEHY